MICARSVGHSASGQTDVIVRVQQAAYGGSRKNIESERAIVMAAELLGSRDGQYR